ncbi:MAG: hypothetical protein K2J10_07385 [Muribaculaceae bacterium]|nr:hypothetical protein [Muribaculaceae bacterium]
MKRLVLLLTIVFTIMTAMAQNTINITANGQTRTAVLADTQAARELAELLANGPITVGMSDYGGFEKVGDLPQSLTTTNRQTTTEPGDIMLYLGRSIVIFYGTNSWSYTPLGKIEGATASDIRAFLSGSNVEVTLSLTSHAGVDEPVISSADKTPEVYTLQGQRIDLNGHPLTTLPKGIYLINGKKQLIK